MASLKDDCIAHWKMNDNAASNVVVDETGDYNGVYHGTGGADDYTSSHDVTGKVSGALELDGTQDYIDTGLKASEIHTSNKFSICMWVKIKTFAANKLFFSADEAGGDRFYLATRGIDSFGIGLSDWTSENFEAVLVVDTWYFLVVILDGTTGYIYLDNVLVGSQTGITVALPTAVTIKLGSNAAGDDPFLHCEMDNVMIFKGIALTEEERIFLYNGGFGTEHLDFPQYRIPENWSW